MTRWTAGRLVWAMLLCASLARAQEPAALPLDGGTGAELTALMDGALERLERESRARGLRHMKAKDYPAALRELNKVYGLNPRDAEVLQRLAELHQLTGNREQALRLYAEALAQEPGRAEAARALAELLVSGSDAPDRVQLQRADALLQQAAVTLGEAPLLRLTRARVGAAAGRYEQALGDYEAAAASADFGPQLLLELGDFQRDFGRYERALQAYRRIERPRALMRQAAQRTFELEVMREARRLGLSNSERALAPELPSLLSRARLAAADGALPAAEALAREAVSLAPAHAPARDQLGSILLQAGRAREAELAMLQALVLGGGDAERLATLAGLYERLDPPREVEAVLYLRRALKLRPDWTLLHLRLAHLEQRRGDLPRALAHLRRYLHQAPEGEQRRAAEALERELGATLGEPDADGVQAEPARPDVATAAILRARAHLGRGAADAALAELQRLPKSARTREVMLLHARLLQASGRLEQAAEALQVLSERDSSHEVLLELARVLQRAGQPARARQHLLQAERDGSTLASLRLVRIDVGSADASLLWDGPHLLSLLHARERLAKLAGQVREAAERDQVAQLTQQLDQRLWRLLLAALLLLLLLALLALWLHQRRNGGIDLRTLVERHPEAGPELQHILSALRHEVLKHNTLMIAGLTETLSTAAPLGDEGAHLRRALFGSDGEQGARERLQTYGRQLQQLGRTHGERLNLSRRDAVMASLQGGMEVLWRAREPLGRASELSPRARRRLLSRLRLADELLNGRGYRELRALLDHIRVHRVLADDLQGIFERVRAEPNLAALSVAPLAFDPDPALPCQVDVPQAAFEDILANLLRNALQASQSLSLQSPIRVGLGVRDQVDPVTGLGRVLFQVHDAAPESLGDEQLRGGYIEQGLGITADLVTRYQGSLSVAPAPLPWVKSVVLALPRAVEEE